MNPVAADTIAYNAAHIAEWQQMDDFDYNRELVESQTGLLQWLFAQLMDFLSSLFEQAMNMELTYWIFIAVIILLLVLTGWFLFRMRSSFFGRNKKEELEYELEQDNIYGIDFDTELQKAVERGDYREAVRLKYLQTLKLLTESERIEWQLHKTVTQYSIEFPNASFQQMTNHFLRIRYGYFDATPEIYEEMVQAYKDLCSQIPASSKDASSAKSEKGGES